MAEPSSSAEGAGMAEHLPLTIGGKTYAVPPPGIQLGTLIAYTQARRTARDKDEADPPLPDGITAEHVADLATNIGKITLGTAWDEIYADNVAFTDVRRAITAATVWYQTGDTDKALAAFDPEGAGGSGPKAGTTTAAATTTKKPEPGTATTSRRRSSKGSARKKA